MQGEKGEIGPEGTPGQMGLPGKNVSELKTHGPPYSILDS